jgi:hypothetical protein
MTGLELFLQYGLPIAAFLIGHWHGSKNAGGSPTPTPPAAPAAPANGVAGILQALGLPAVPTTVGHGELVQYLAQILQIVQKLQVQLPAMTPFPMVANPPWQPPQQQPVVAGPGLGK